MERGIFLRPSNKYFMHFRLFLEAELPNNFSLYYDLRTKKWDHKGSSSIYLLGRKPSKYNATGYVDIEGVGRHYPELSEILTSLVRQFPELANSPIKFDGPAMETVSQVIQRVSAKDYTGMPKDLFHGTSTWHYEKIKEAGLQPRRITGVPPSYQMGAAPGNQDIVYLMDNDGNAVRFAAREASMKANHAGYSAEPLVLKIDGRQLRKRNFRPDEDHKLNNDIFKGTEQDWQRSLWGMGAIAYAADIPPTAIQPYMALDDNNQWAKV